MEKPFEPGEEVVWVNALNVAFRARVMREYVDETSGSTRVAVEFYNENGYKTNASPHRERVGHLASNFDTVKKE